jgi:hypothetical protein
MTSALVAHLYVVGIPVMQIPHLSSFTLSSVNFIELINVNKILNAELKEMLNLHI